LTIELPYDHDQRCHGVNDESIGYQIDRSVGQNRGVRDRRGRDRIIWLFKTPPIKQTNKTK